MCSIDKLLIKGVRSFSPDNLHVIEFYKPLTLIVGQNGAGKTTVIECLKQACTGELPPNTRSGQSFIHDPKVAGETEVKAQIKLRVRTAEGAPVVIVRAFQLTQKKTALQFKALDQVLQMYDKETGQKTAISYKCVDIDRQVPQLMGVSKAVLENVIFVHQEDSNWPLAEGLVLKRKFDDIFAATKYTKYLEVLRKAKTETTAESKSMRLKLDHLKTHKDTSTKLRGEIDAGRAQAVKLQSQMEQLQAQIQKDEEAAAVANNKLTQFNQLHSKVENLKTKQQTLAKTNGEMYARWTTRWGSEDADASLDDLHTWLNNLDPQMRAANEELRQLTRETDRARASLQQYDAQTRQDSHRKHQLEAQLEQHKRTVSERDSAVRQAAAECGLGVELGREGELSPQAVHAFDQAFSSRQRELQQQLQATKAANRNTDEQMGRLLDGVTGELVGVEEGTRLKQQQLDANEDRIQALSSQMNRIGVTRGQLENAQEAEDEATEAVEKARATLERLNASGEQAQLDGDLQAVQARISQLRKERDGLSVAGETATKAKMKRRELRNVEDELEDLLKPRNPKLDNLLGTRGRDLPAHGELKAAVEAAARLRTTALAGARRAAQEAQSTASSDRSTALAAQQALEAAEQELSAAKAALADGILHAASQSQSSTQGQEDLQALTAAKEEELNNNLKKAQNLEAIVSFSQLYKEHATDTHECYTCGRPLSDAELDEFNHKQDLEVAELPERKRETATLERTLKQQLSSLRQLQPVFSRLQDLDGSIVPAAHRKAEAATRRAEASAQDAQEKQAAIAAAERAVQEAQELQENVAWPLHRKWEDKQALEAELEKLSQQQLGAAAGRTVADVDAEMETQDAERTRLQAARDELLAKISRARDEVQETTTSYHRVHEDKIRLKTLAEQRTTLQNQIDEVSKSNGAAYQEIERLGNKLPSLKEQQQRLRQERKKKRGEAAAREAEIDEQQQALVSRGAHLSSLQAQFRRFEDEHIAEHLEQVSQAIRSTGELQQASQAKLQEIETRSSTLESKIRDQQETRQQVSELISLQTNRKEEEDVASQITECEGQMEQISGGNPQGLHEEFTRHKRSTAALRSQRDVMRGSLSTTNENVGRAQTGLDQPQYRGIDARFKTQQIQLQNLVMATFDLDQYHKALEKALLAFHTTKMTDINKTIKELWQRTYRNQDIDYIQVKADSEGAGARSYNYRVVMMSGGVELDMRGRCSAGQKVLACLIIRLALAETFCLNCGILALDEPTTNLDAANAESLAGALRNIIEARRVQQNFQLIVITHDEKFGSMIGTREFADHRWRITKDDSQHSHIEMEDIEDIGD